VESWYVPSTFLDFTAQTSVWDIDKLPLWQSSRRWHRVSFVANLGFNAICAEDDNMYAAHLLFMLICSKHVCNATLWLLEKFVNSPLLTMDYILELDENDLKQEIQHLGLGNKNTTDVIKIFQQIKKYTDKHGHFPHTL